MLVSVMVSVLSFIHFLLFILFLCNNYKKFGGIFGDQTFVSQQKNHDGILGMLSNMVRYLLTMPALSSQYYKELVIFLHDKVLNLGIVGTDMSFAKNYNMTLSGHEDLAGVGCLFLLIFCLSPLLFVIMRGKFERLLIATSIILFASICYSLAWNPWWVRFFPFAFVPLAPIVAIIADKRNIKYSIIPIVIIFCISAFVTFGDNIIKNYNNICLAITNRDELYNQRNPYVFDNASVFKGISGRTLIFARENDPIYQYFVLMKNASIEVLSSDKCRGDNSRCDISKYIDDNNISTIIDLGAACGSLGGHKTIFESQNDFSKIRILSGVHS